MSPDDNPRTFREVALLLKNIKGQVDAVKQEVDEIKKAVSRLMGIVFTAVIGPIIVAIIIAYVIKPG